MFFISILSRFHTNKFVECILDHLCFHAVNKWVQHLWEAQTGGARGGTSPQTDVEVNPLCHAERRKKKAGPEHQEANGGFRGEAERKGKNEFRGGAEEKDDANWIREEENCSIGSAEEEEEYGEAKEQTDDNQTDMATMEGLGI
ncbi:hypothetical protein NDU88_008824 [Pleurodeles waltl]|uniref:Uncharacterized protein n=1 Tax=Pleurodeles waltl TaxID=8319 RepID=A0AAV7P0F4_PLEWA|nr:hypothetical protein NDU88_008824 [Pleurodeles waltl]